MGQSQGLSSLGSSLRSHLKTLLKAKKISYRTLAAELGVSEITVKRWMTSQDMQLENFIQICRILQVNPVHLVESDFSDEFMGKEYSREQENYLAANPVEFLVFIKALMGHDFSDIRKHCRLSINEMLTSCRHLETQGLLRLEANNKIRMLIQGPFRWRKNGRLEKTYFHQYRDVLLEHFRQNQTAIDRPKENDISLFRPFEFYLDDPTATEMSAEFARVLLKYRRISHKNARNWKSRKPVAGIIAVSFFDAWSKVYLK